MEEFNATQYVSASDNIWRRIQDFTRQGCGHDIAEVNSNVSGGGGSKDTPQAKKCRILDVKQCIIGHIEAKIRYDISSICKVVLNNTLMFLYEVERGTYVSVCVSNLFGS